MRQDVEEEVGGLVELEHHRPGEADVDRVREQSDDDIGAGDAEEDELDGDPRIVRPHSDSEESVRVLLVVVDEIVFGELPPELTISEGLQHFRMRSRPDARQGGHSEEPGGHDDEVPTQPIQRQRQADDEEACDSRQSPAGHGGEMIPGAVDDGREPGSFEGIRGDGRDPREILRRRPVELKETSRLLGRQRVPLRQCRQLQPVIAVQLGQQVRIHSSTLSETKLGHLRRDERLTACSGRNARLGAGNARPGTQRYDTMVG